MAKKYDKFTNVSESGLQIKLPETNCKLSDNFGNLFDNGLFSDVTVAIGGFEVKSHKNILAARSDVFAAMFKHEMDETKLSRVVITDVDHAVMMEMLRFIYTDKAPNLDEMADDLFRAADKYQLERLKAMCEQSLGNILCIDNAVQTLILADLHNADQLKEKTIDFINNNTEVMKTKFWKDMKTTHLRLFAEVLEALVTKQISSVEPTTKRVKLN